MVWILCGPRRALSLPGSALCYAGAPLLPLTKKRFRRYHTDMEPISDSG